VRGMKLYRHPRPLPLLRRIRRLLRFFDQNPSHASLSCPHITPGEPRQSLPPAFNLFDAAQHRLFLIPRHPLRPIQST
jgi:hypothetical protein